MQKTMAIYGSAANPPHRGHIDAIEQLLAQVDEVRFLPSANHAFGKAMLPYEHRLRMATLLIQESFGEQGRVTVDDVEACLARTGTPVYSIEVLRAMRKRYPDYRILLAVGPDNAAPEIWSKFRDYHTIDREFGKLVVAQRLPIRSTLIREKITAAEDVESVEFQQWLVAQVGQAVAQYILAHELFRKRGATASD